MSELSLEYGMVEGIRIARAGREGRSWLVMTHGAFCSLTDWLPFLEQLGQHYSLLLWDLPGHAGSATVPPVKSLDQAADTLAKVMASAQVDRAVQLGFSFGGMVAQAFARRYPERTDALIAYGCVPITKVKAPPKWLLKVLLRMRFRLTRREDFISQFTDQATIAPQVRDTLARAMLDARADLAPAIFEAMVAGSSWEPDFALQCPTALITGERDDRFPGAREQMVRWGQSLPRDLWADVKECGHVVHLESPTGFANALHHVINKLQERR